METLSALDLASLDSVTGGVEPAAAAAAAPKSQPKGPSTQRPRTQTPQSRPPNTTERIIGCGSSVAGNQIRGQSFSNGASDFGDCVLTGQPPKRYP